MVPIPIGWNSRAAAKFYGRLAELQPPIKRLNILARTDWTKNTALNIFAMRRIKEEKTNFDTAVLNSLNKVPITFAIINKNVANLHDTISHTPTMRLITKIMNSFNN